MNSRWALFRDRNFLLFWVGYLLSGLGDAVFSITLSWMIVQLTGSGVVMGTYLMVMGIPRLLLMLVGGVVVDRMNPRKVMMYSDVLRALVMFLFFAVSIGGHPPLWTLFIVAVLFGAVDAFYWPASSAMRQNLVRKEQFTQSTGIIMGTMQMTSILGPLAGASLLAFGGYRLGIAVNAVSFVISALTLFYVRLLAREEQTEIKAERRSFKQDLGEGLRFVWKMPVILTMMWATFLANAGANGVGIGLPFLAQSFHVGAAGYSHMSAGFGIGGVTGAVVMSLLVIKRPTPRMALFAFFVQGIAIGMITLAGNQWTVAVLMAVVGISSTAIQVIFPSVNQQIIPPELMGRVSSLNALMSMGSTPFAQAGAGWVIDAFGPHSIYLYGGLLEVVASGAAMMVPAVREFGKRVDLRDRSDVSA